MEDYRHRLVVIVAGYPRLMHRLPRLESRACGRGSRARSSSPTTRPTSWSRSRTPSRARTSTCSARTPHAELRRILDGVERGEGFGNARFSRTLFEQALNAQALRLTGEETTLGPVGADELKRLTAADVAAAARALGEGGEPSRRWRRRRAAR